MVARSQTHVAARKEVACTYVIYRTTFTPNLVRIEFSKLTSQFQVLKMLYAFRTDPSVTISGVVLIRYRGGVSWYNDITAYKDSGMLRLLLKIKDEAVRTGVEASSVFDASMLNYSMVMEISTLNVSNSEPRVISDEEFRSALLAEVSGLM